MKHSYKLLGVLWDRTPQIPLEQLPQESINGFFVENYDIEKNLLDIDEYNRKINLSEILSVETEENLNEILCKIKDCKNLYIKKDFLPKQNNKITNQFFQKRIEQVIYFFEQKMTKSNIHLLS